MMWRGVRNWPFCTLESANIHNRWHPDIPMACWVNPGDDFILETFDWTGGFIRTTIRPTMCATST